MKCAIADPPYLGRASRHYGPGANGKIEFGSGPIRSANGRRPSVRYTTEHRDAAEWDDPARHEELIHDLESNYDAYAIPTTQIGVPIYLAAAPAARLAIWVNPRQVPGGHRILRTWEGVVFSTPRGERDGVGSMVRDVLVAPNQAVGHVGAKPTAWTRWVLALLGADPLTDEIHDLYPGSGSVSHVLNQGILL